MIEVWSNTEFGHVFSVVKLDEPGPKGRMFRLFDNGQPALGGQWHYTVANAIARAEYVLQGSYSRRIAYLEQRVQVLEAQIEGRRVKLRWGTAGGYHGPLFAGVPEEDE